MTLYVCSNCRDGTYYEAEEILVPEPQPHGELLHFWECPKCASREHLFQVSGDTLRQFHLWGKAAKDDAVRQWAVDVLYDIATGQVAA